MQLLRLLTYRDHGALRPGVTEHIVERLLHDTTRKIQARISSGSASGSRPQPFTRAGRSLSICCFETSGGWRQTRYTETG